MSRELDKPMEICSPRHLAELYLCYGSVEEALAKNPNLPISVPDFHRKVKSYGIIKGAGRQKVSLAEVLYFFARKIGEPNIPIERLYKTMPWAIRESASLATLHRIYQQVCERMVRTYAAALVITTANPRQVLVADEKTENEAIGKIKGSTSLLMGFGAKGEPFEDSVLRVLQREFSTEFTLNGQLAKNGELTKIIIPETIQPFMYLHLLDVQVAVFHLRLPDVLSDRIGEIASSYKVTNHRFMPLYDVLSASRCDERFRMGTREILEGYQIYRFGFGTLPLIRNALINENMLALS